MTKTKQKPQPPVRSIRIVNLRLKRADTLQVWRDAIVGHQTDTSSRRKAQYGRIVVACDAALYPKQANAKVK